jgi:asparagine synthetase B (glutamine-hydrolysing)
MASLAGIISQDGKIDFNGTKQMGRMLNDMRHRAPVWTTLWMISCPMSLILKS